MFIMIKIQLSTSAIKRAPGGRQREVDGFPGVELSLETVGMSWNRSSSARFQTRERTGLHLPLANASDFDSAKERRQSLRE
jgi:hypothetical protein